MRENTSVLGKNKGGLTKRVLLEHREWCLHCIKASQNNSDRRNLRMFQDKPPAKSRSVKSDFSWLDRVQSLKLPKIQTVSNSGPSEWQLCSQVCQQLIQLMSPHHRHTHTLMSSAILSTAHTVHLLQVTCEDGNQDNSQHSPWSTHVFKRLQFDYGLLGTALWGWQSSQLFNDAYPLVT